MLVQDGWRLLSINDLFGFNARPDTACGENIDIHRVDKYFNPLMSGGNKKVTHTSTNLQLKAAGLCE